MIRFTFQPGGLSFGSLITTALSTGRWTAFDVAVAWVRRSGSQRLSPALRGFLSTGGTARIVVGLDMQNTSREGLEDLLDLAAFGSIELYAYHNEAGPIFHPKVYLLSNSTEAHLFVGSSNLTEPGLFTNTEANIDLELPRTDPIIASAENSLTAWRDTSTGLARLLDPAQLDLLVKEHYLLTERELQRQRSVASAILSRGIRRVPLFPRVTIPEPPPIPTGVAVRERLHGATPTNTLFMRLRKAHEVDRPTQAQIPFRLREDPFFAGITHVQSGHDGVNHRFVDASARGGRNTVKLELPEMRNFVEPVARFVKGAGGIRYEVFDSSSPQGASIKRALEAGLKTTPRATHLTRPGDPIRSTWWRFL